MNTLSKSMDLKVLESRRLSYYILNLSVLKVKTDKVNEIIFITLYN